MTEAELKAIEERAEKATPGPWTFDTDMDSVVADEWWNGEHSERTITTLPVQPVAVTDLQREATGQFIAHSRTDIPDLLAHIRAVEAERNNAIEALDLNMKWIGPPPTDNHSYDSLRQDAWKLGLRVLVGRDARQLQALQQEKVDQP